MHVVAKNRASGRRWLTALKKWYTRTRGPPSGDVKPSIAECHSRRSSLDFDHLRGQNDWSSFCSRRERMPSCKSISCAGQSMDCAHIRIFFLINNLAWDVRNAIIHVFFGIVVQLGDNEVWYACSFHQDVAPFAILVAWLSVHAWNRFWLCVPKFLSSVCVYLLLLGLIFFVSSIVS